MQRVGHIVAEMSSTRPDNVIVECLIFEDQDVSYPGVLSKLPPLSNAPHVLVDAFYFHQITEGLDVICKRDGLKGRSRVQAEQVSSQDRDTYLFV